MNVSLSSQGPVLCITTVHKVQWPQQVRLHSHVPHQHTASFQCHRRLRRTALSWTMEGCWRNSRCSIDHNPVHPIGDHRGRTCIARCFHCQCRRSSHSPHIRWDGDGFSVVVDAGTDVPRAAADLIKSSCKCPDVFPGIKSMCKANTIHVLVINCETTVTDITVECIWWPLLVPNDLATYICVLYTINLEGRRGAATSINVHSTESLWSGKRPQSFRTCLIAVVHVDFGHLHPASWDTLTGHAHVTVHAKRRAICAPEPVVARRSSGIEVLNFPAGSSRVAGGTSRRILGHVGGSWLLTYAWGSNVCNNFLYSSGMMFLQCTVNGSCRSQLRDGSTIYTTLNHITDLLTCIQDREHCKGSMYQRNKADLAAFYSWRTRN